MTIDRLRYFAAVVEAKSLRKASEMVGIAPPSMSKAISTLEDELGCKLLHADGRGIGVTAKGLEIYRLSVPLIEEHQRFFKRIRESDKKDSLLRMATFEVFSSYFISAFLKSEPDIEILLLEKTPGAIEASILSGVVDFGLTYVPSPDRSLEYIEIGSFSMGIFGNRKWEKEAFENWPFAVPTTEMRIHSSDIDSLDMWPRSAPNRKVKYRFELLETALQTSREGLSVLHCPEFIVSIQNSQVKDCFRLSRLSPPSRYRRLKDSKVYLVGRKGALPDRLNGKLAKFMRSLK